MPDGPQNGSGERLARLEQDIAHLKEGLALLGARACCLCGKFHLSSTPASLFTTGSESVCYACLPAWWKERCGRLSVPERQSIEYPLMRWLIANHGAKVFQELRELPPPEHQDFRMVVTCHECRGTGRMGSDRCRHCLGNRNVWVVTMK